MFGDPEQRRRKKDFVYCDKCGEKLYYSDGFNYLNNKKLCSKCYRKERNSLYHRRKIKKTMA